VRPAARAAVAIAATGIASAAYQQAADMADRRRFPPPGQLADIGGRRIHLLAMGTGTPAVVIIPSLGGNVLEWVRVQRAAAANTTVITCDRAGIGWSDPPPLGTLTLDSMADDLHAALKSAGISPPYVIAGHSLGGVVARRFQARYPDAVTGMLLVDSSHEGQSRRFGWRDGAGSQLRHAARFQSRILGVRRLAASLGRLSDVSPASLARETVLEYAGAARAITLSSRLRRIAVREMILAAQLRGQPQGLGAVSLTVISTANRRRDWWPLWARMQDELAALSSDTVHMTAVKAGHNVHLDEPMLVVQAIRDLVDRCRELRAECRCRSLSCGYGHRHTEGDAVDDGGGPVRGGRAVGRAGGRAGARRRGRRPWRPPRCQNRPFQGPRSVTASATGALRARFRW
jgi:pimeloyl-ACP methyl ester carboxylesterase